MALRVHTSGIGGIDRSVQRRALILLYVVVKGIDHFAGVDAPGVVPKHTIVNRTCLNARLHKVVTASQQREFLLKQAGHLSLESKQRGGNVSVGAILRADTDSRVGGIRPTVVADHHVQVVHISCREQQGVISRAVINPGIDA